MVGALAMLPRGRHTLGARPEVPVSEFVATPSLYKSEESNRSLQRCDAIDRIRWDRQMPSAPIRRPPPPRAGATRGAASALFLSAIDHDQRGPPGPEDSAAPACGSLVFVF